MRKIEARASLGRFTAAALAVSLAGIAVAQAGPVRYMVLPFENRSGERSLDWLGEALSESIGRRLEALGMRTVTRRERLDALEDLALTDGTPLTIATKIGLAEDSRALRLVTGSFQFRKGEGVEVFGRLLDLTSMKQLWQGARAGKLAETFSLMDPLVREAAATDLNRISPGTLSALDDFDDPPLAAYEVIVRSYDEEEPEKRAAIIRRLWESNRDSVHLTRALAFALADSGKVEDALKLIDTIPSGSQARDWRLYLMQARLLLADRRDDEALEALSRSLAAGESAEAHLLLARIHFNRGDSTRASAELDLAEGLDPDHPDLPEIRSLAPEPAR